VLTRISPGFAAVRVKLKRISLLRRLPGWTIAGVVTSGTVGAAATTSGIGQEEINGTTTTSGIGQEVTNGTTTSGDGLVEAAATSGVGPEEAAATTGVVETNGTTTIIISGDGREEAAATTGVEVARTMTGVAGNHP